ncbi:MAG: sigma 54-interacting transcriptional regulator [Verrucomicrobiales bacterium]|nr:sigma 54-interacting transcriptional regulator [Verrucomicrobiales bacterium]
MVSMAQNRSLPDLLRAIVSGIAQCENVVLARIWLLAPGDICGSCRFRPECPDQTRCLHLAASAGNPGDRFQDYSRLDGAFRRFPLGVRKIGRVGKSGEPLLLADVRGDEEWIAEPDWMRREGVRTFAAQPLLFHGEVLGVLAIFDTKVLGQEDFNWLRVFADHASVSIANARAFEEIEFLKARLEEENHYLRQEVTEAVGANGIVGGSPALRKVLQQIQLVAPTDAAVLITGESGTGKELVARALHEGSPRRDRALIKVNCGAVPETLFESEFFGHARGAFTGALKDKPGRFELADGGTLFLDEIGEVPLAMQAKLLRVLQEQEIERVGESRVRKVNVRIVAATNRDLKQEVAAGRFRQDLFYRLGVFPIEVPPLRERSEDVAPLAAHFIRLAAKRGNRPVPRFTKAHAAQLAAHDWPGNIRELQNTVERAVILAQNGPLHFELPQSVPPRSASTGTPPEETHSILTRDEWKRRERESIAAALRQSGGKVFGRGGAAELLNMKPTTLASRIKALALR